MAVFRYTVKKEDTEIPIKQIIRREFSFSSRLMTKIKKNRCAFLNGESMPGWVTADEGDILEVRIPDEKSDFDPENIPIYPVYEDDDILVINKQPYVIVHPTKGHPVHTIANGLMKYMNDTGQSFKIRFVNRLDMDTSGLLIIGKNSHTQDSLMKQMKTNRVEKKYIAVLKGVITDDEGTIDLPIGRPDPERVERGVMEDGDRSITHYRVMERFKRHTLVELLLETGRTHQIRVHMSHIGYPVLGDYLYGGEAPSLIERQALHARFLSFYHPVTGERIVLEAPLYDDMNNLIKKLREE